MQFYSKTSDNNFDPKANLCKETIEINQYAPNNNSNETENINCELYSSVSSNPNQILNESSHPKALLSKVISTKSNEVESGSSKNSKNTKTKTKTNSKRVKTSSKESSSVTSSVASIELSLASNASNDQSNEYCSPSNETNSNNLVKDFRKAKSEDTNIIEISKEPGSLTVATCNPGGLRSKAKTVENFCFRNDIGALAVCETHYAGRQKPYISKNYQVFHKNRKKSKSSCKGGVALFLKNEIADHAVIIDQGEGNQEEFLSVKLNNYSPPVLLFILYGPQQTTRKENLENLWEKVKSLWKKYDDLGWITLAMGDFNAAIGNNGGVKNNHPSVNPAGRILLQTLDEMKWELVNKLADGDSRTHIDRSNPASSRCLDYIVTNSIQRCQEAVVDNKLQATPYIVNRGDDGPESRKFSDHKTIIARFKMDPAPVKKIVQPPKFIRNEKSRAEFALETDEIAEEGLEMLARNEDILKIVKMVDRKVKKAEYKCHKRIKPNRPLVCTEDEAIFWSLTDAIENDVKQVKDMKVNHQIYKLNQKRKFGERGSPLFQMNTKGGDLADTREEIENVILKHNQELLQRKQHSLNYKQIHKMKKDVLDTLLETQISEYNTFSFRDYVKIVNKIYLKKKPMFQAFRDSTPRFKAMIYWILKKIYEDETIPEDFHETSLIALFKKGDTREPGNYRYLQVKRYLPRLFEDAVYMKIEATFDQETPDSQAGSKKESDCLENLVILIAALNKSTLEGAGLCLTFVDIVKCFDRLYLSDSQWFLLNHGGDPKAIKVLTLLLGTTKLKLQGSNKEFTISDGQGQGGVSVARSASATISDIMDRNVENHPKKFYLNGVQVSNMGYVDDTMCIDSDAIGVIFSCMIIEETLEELALEAHKDKTKNVICGDKKRNNKNQTTKRK